jgi:DNA (cytosine-5)-methyltransferase 1
MKHLDLFSGIGGFALAAWWAGYETVAFCEKDMFCQKVLKKHWPDVPIFDDIREFDGDEFKGKIDLLTGGYLWPEMFRVITQTKPDWVICENVYGHVTLGLDNVLADLESRNYTAQSFIVPALATGRNHRRDRVYIVANAASDGRDESKASTSDGTTNGERGAEKQDKARHDERRGSLWDKMDWNGKQTGRRGTEPPALRVDAGVPNRLDRNRALGNAIVPEIAYRFMMTIQGV